jgi:hypothetical protein
LVKNQGANDNDLYPHLFVGVKTVVFLFTRYLTAGQAKDAVHKFGAQQEGQRRR